MFDIHKSILPCGKYKVRRRLDESERAWHTRKAEARAGCFHPSSTVLATQIRLRDELIIGVICARPVPDFCAGLFIHSACTYKADDWPGRRHGLRDPKAISDDELLVAKTLVPDIRELSGMNEVRLAEVYDILRRSLVAGVLSHAYSLGRPCLQWADKVDGPTQVVMDHLRPSQLAWMNPLSTNKWAVDPRDVGRVDGLFERRQVEIVANTVDTAPIKNPNSGNDVILHAATLAWGDIRASRTSYPINSMRDPSWWTVLPSREIRNG